MIRYSREIDVCSHSVNCAQIRYNITFPLTWAIIAPAYLLIDFDLFQVMFTNKLYIYTYLVHYGRSYVLLRIRHRICGFLQAHEHLTFQVFVKIKYLDESKGLFQHK